MGRNKDLNNRIAGYEKIVARHEDKIQAELAKETPNEFRTQGWKREIRVWRGMIARLSRRLKRDW